MRNFFLGILITLVIVLVYRQCTSSSEISIKTSSDLIQNQLKQVSKLIVTEAYISEVFNYKNSKEIFGDYFTADKKALVIVNAKVLIAYDLKQLNYRLHEDSKTIEILNIPDREISIYPDLEYYDVQADFLNPFESKDYNNIKESIKTELKHKVEDLPLVKNAQNRLISELANIYTLTESLGWTLIYKSEPITSDDQIKALDL